MNWFTTITPFSTLLQRLNIHSTGCSISLMHVSAAVWAKRWTRVSNLRSGNKVQIPWRKIRILEVGFDGDWLHSLAAYIHERAARERHESGTRLTSQISIAVLSCLNSTWILNVKMNNVTSLFTFDQGTRIPYPIIKCLIVYSVITRSYNVYNIIASILFCPMNRSTTKCKML